METQSQNTNNAKSRLFQAIETSNVNWVKEIVQAGDDLEEVDEDYYPGYSPLDLAAELGNIEIISILLKAGVNVDYSQESSPLHMAIETGKVDAVKLLISAGADLEFEVDDGVTALMAAVMTGNMIIVKLLIEAGADLNACSRFGTASEIAQMYGYPEISRELLSMTSKT